MKLLREPLLHFVLAGALLFAAYAWLQPGTDARHRIVVSTAQVESIVAQFEGTWQRPPTPDELRGLVDAWVRDEILYREGEAMGLQRDDPVIKRRVRQKYEVMSEESLAGAPPGDDELAAFLAANADEFRQPPRVSFAQVLVVPLGAQVDIDAAVAAAGRALAAGADPARVGQPTMLPGAGENVALDLVARDFGEEFAAQLASLPPGDWTGPVKSGFGVHLVRLDARTAGVVPPLADIRPAVAREWESARRLQAREAHLQELRKRYEVDVQADFTVVPVAHGAAR